MFQAGKIPECRSLIEELETMLLMGGLGVGSRRCRSINQSPLRGCCRRTQGCSWVRPGWSCRNIINYRTTSNQPTLTLKNLLRRRATVGRRHCSQRSWGSSNGEVISVWALATALLNLVWSCGAGPHNGFWHTLVRSLVLVCELLSWPL